MKLKPTWINVYQIKNMFCFPFFVFLHHTAMNNFLCNNAKAATTSWTYLSSCQPFDGPVELFDVRDEVKPLWDDKLVPEGPRDQDNVVLNHPIKVK